MLCAGYTPFPPAHGQCPAARWKPGTTGTGRPAARWKRLVLLAGSSPCIAVRWLLVVMVVSRSVRRQGSQCPSPSRQTSVLLNKCVRIDMQNEPSLCLEANGSSRMAARRLVYFTCNCHVMSPNIRTYAPPLLHTRSRTSSRRLIFGFVPD